MKKNKFLAVILAMAVAVGAAGVTTYAVGKDANDTEAPSTVVTAASASDTEAVKDETVYVMTAADGSTQKILVSDWIKNALPAEARKAIESLNDAQQVRWKPDWLSPPSPSFLPQAAMLSTSTSASSRPTARFICFIASLSSESCIWGSLCHVVYIHPTIFRHSLQEKSASGAGTFAPAPDASAPQTSATSPPDRPFPDAWCASAPAAPAR